MIGKTGQLKRIRNFLAKISLSSVLAARDLRCIVSAGPVDCSCVNLAAARYYRQRAACIRNSTRYTAMCTSCSVNFCASACWRFIDNMVRGARIFRQSSAPLHVTQMRRAVSQRLLLIEIYCERLFYICDCMCGVFIGLRLCVVRTNVDPFALGVGQRSPRRGPVH